VRISPLFKGTPRAVPDTCRRCLLSGSLYYVASELPVASLQNIRSCIGMPIIWYVVYKTTKRPVGLRECVNLQCGHDRGVCNVTCS
jgi:hypothetical protein